MSSRTDSGDASPQTREANQAHANSMPHGGHSSAEPGTMGSSSDKQESDVIRDAHRAPLSRNPSTPSSESKNGVTSSTNTLNDMPSSTDGSQERLLDKALRDCSLDDPEVPSLSLDCPEGSNPSLHGPGARNCAQDHPDNPNPSPDRSDGPNISLDGPECPNPPLHGPGDPELEGPDPDAEIEYSNYENELQMPEIMQLIQRDLSEPYSIYTYRYFINNWPNLCFLARCQGRIIGAIVCKLDSHDSHTKRVVTSRGYIAMLAVDKRFRKRRIGSCLVLNAIRTMAADAADEVVLETEVTNTGALRLYENLGFVRDKRLFRYYLNGVDALRLKLWLWPP